jgi:hypothetical protein
MSFIDLVTERLSADAYCTRSVAERDLGVIDKFQAVGGHEFADGTQAAVNKVMGTVRP